MLSGFRRRHKVSQRSVRVLERLPRRERRGQRVHQNVSVWALTAFSTRGRCGASCEARRVHPPGRARRGGGVRGVHELRRRVLRVALTVHEGGLERTLPPQSLIRVHQAGEGCGGSGVQGEAQGAADSVPGATSLLSARGGGRSRPGRGVTSTSRSPPPDLQSLVQDLQRQQQDLQR